MEWSFKIFRNVQWQHFLASGRVFLSYVVINFETSQHDYVFFSVMTTCAGTAVNSHRGDFVRGQGFVWQIGLRREIQGVEDVIKQ